MKKQALLATVSLALVAMASCGGSSSNETPSTSDSISSVTEPTLEEQWDAITNWQGGVEQAPFFEKTSTLDVDSGKATSRKVFTEDRSGEAGTLFGMENDWGYINQDFSGDCSIYNNDVRVCSYVEVSDRTDEDTGNVVTSTLRQTANAYIVAQTEANFFVSVVDDGSEVKDIPNNYYQAVAMEDQSTFADYAGFALASGEGSIVERFSLAYYNTGMSEAIKAATKYYTEAVEGGTAYSYWLYREIFDEQQRKHNSSLKIQVIYNGDTLNSVVIDQAYLFQDMNVFTSVQTINYTYADNGNFTGTVFDYRNYKVYGLIETRIQQGDLPFGSMLNLLLTAYNAGAYDKPIQSTAQNAIYNDWEYDITYQRIENIVTNSYSDGYVVSDYSMEQISLETGRVETGTKSVQLSADTNNIYEVTRDYDNSTYKVTTPINEEEGDTWANASNIVESWALSLMIYINNNTANSSGRTPFSNIALSAYMLGDGMVELIAEGVAQQGNDGILGARWISDIVFSFKTTALGQFAGVIIHEAATVQDAIYNWEVLGEDFYSIEYAYGDAISTSDAKYTIIDPSTVAEKPADPATPAGLLREVKALKEVY